MQLNSVNRIAVCFTYDEALAGLPVALRRPADVIEYLNSDPCHAVVIHDVVGTDGQTLDNPLPVYILRGAGEDLSNFYYGECPAEDPNDAEGGDLTAEQALFQALDMMRMFCKV